MNDFHYYSDKSKYLEQEYQNEYEDIVAKLKSKYSKKMRELMKEIIESDLDLPTQSRLMKFIILINTK